MRKIKWLVVVVTVIALFVTALDGADARRRRCRRRPACRRAGVGAPAPAPRPPTDPRIVFTAGAPIADTSNGRATLTVPSQGDKHIVDVDVVLDFVSATVPDDLRVSILKDDIHATPLMAGVGGNTAASDIGLTFDDESVRSVPDDGPLTRGTFRPSTSPTTAAGLSRLDGADPAGTWLLVASGTSGSIEGWSISLTLGDGPGTGGPVLPPPGAFVAEFSGPGGALRDDGPLPIQTFTIDVPAHPGRGVGGIEVLLDGLTHARADDLDVIVKHGSTTALLFSDVGGATGVAQLDLRIFDGASSPMPDEDQLTSGAFRPTRGTPIDGGIGGDTATSLSVFDGQDPSGTWSLTIIDDTSGETGTLDGWSIRLELE